MNLDSLLPNLGEWLRGTGPESDVVVSTRIECPACRARYSLKGTATRPVVYCPQCGTQTRVAVADQGSPAGSEPAGEGPDKPPARFDLH